MHYINKISAEQDGQNVTINGWIANVRTSSKNLFLNVRDGSVMRILLYH